MMEFDFRARVWVYEGTAAWHFVTLPAQAAEQLEICAAIERKAFGTVRVEARIGNTRWKTSLFRDRKRNSYLLPLKAAVRAREQLHAGEEVEVLIIADLAPLATAAPRLRSTEAPGPPAPTRRRARAQADPGRP